MLRTSCFYIDLKNTFKHLGHGCRGQINPVVFRGEAEEEWVTKKKVEITTTKERTTFIYIGT